MECEVCYEEYDSGNHKPLCLTCGHTFCFSCILGITNDTGSTTKCPKCKQETFQPINDMSVVYALIPSENNPQRASRSQSGRSCPQHQKTLDYLCVDCLELTCFKCFKMTHAKHAVEMVEDLLQGVEAVDARAVVRTKISDKLEPVNDMLTWIDELMNLYDDLKKWKDSLQDQKKTIEQDLQAWDGSVTEKDENKIRKYEEILSRLKSKPAEITNLPEFKAKLDAASRKCEAMMDRLRNTYTFPRLEFKAKKSPDWNEISYAFTFPPVMDQAMMDQQRNTFPRLEFKAKKSPDRNEIFDAFPFPAGISASHHLHSDSTERPYTRPYRSGL